MLIACFQLATCDTWDDNRDQANLYVKNVNVRMNMGVCVVQYKEGCPVVSPKANQTGWTETYPPLPLSHVAC